MPSSPAPGPTAPAVTALIPLRTGGKSRLGDAIEGEARAQLVLAMLDDVVGALRAAGIEDVRLLASGPGAVQAAQARGIPAILDPEPGPRTEADLQPAVSEADLRLRAAVDAGLAQVAADRRRMVVMCDLPRLRPADVTAVLAQAADVVVAPTVSDGTAILSLAPGVLLPSRYGAGSATAHAEAARTSGRSVTLLDLPGARHDVDAETDLRALDAPQAGTGMATASFLAGTRG
jgi:2-phospho-L-lactate/phosphoenolpyruvate guanylyltransferase